MSIKNGQRLQRNGVAAILSPKGNAFTLEIEGRGVAPMTVPTEGDILSRVEAFLKEHFGNHDGVRWIAEQVRNEVTRVKNRSSRKQRGRRY